MAKQKEASATIVAEATENPVAATSEPVAENTALAEVPKAAVPAEAPARPTQVAGYDVGDVGTGFEDFTQDDLAVPFVAILQKGSPQVEEENPKAIPGAKAGMLMNTVSQQLYEGKEKGILVIPVHRVRSFIEWIPKDDGGGLVEVFDPEAPQVLEVLKKAGKKFGKLKINDNNDLAETFNVYCLLVDEASYRADPNAAAFQRVVLGFASSQIGPYKKWMTTAQTIQVPGAGGRLQTPPLFSHLYRARTEFTQKKEYTWFKWKLGFFGADAAASRLPNESPLFEEAKLFRAMLQSGKARADYSGLQAEETVAAEFEM